MPTRLCRLLLGISLALAAAGGGEAEAETTSDTGIFSNPGLFVTVEEPLGSLTITEDMIRAGESDPLTATLRVDATTAYSLRVEIATEADVDLAGSTVNTAHPMVASERDVFFIRVSDHTGDFPDFWRPGSSVALLTNQPPSSGNPQGNEHLVQLRVRFSDVDGPYFSQALPGDYAATLTFEVEPQ